MKGAKTMAKKLERLMLVNGKKVALSKKELEIVKVLRQHKKQWVGPTKIGQALGQDYEKASSWACHGLKRLVALGVVERGESPNKGQYRLVTVANYGRK
jgi:hypothetical protein